MASLKDRIWDSRVFKQLYIILASIILSFLLWVSAIQEESRYETIPIPLKFTNKSDFFDDYVEVHFKNIVGNRIKARFMFTENLRQYIDTEYFVYSFDLSTIPIDSYGINEFKTISQRLDKGYVESFSDIPESIKCVEIIEPRELLIELKLNPVLKKVNIVYAGTVKDGYEINDIITRVGNEEFHKNDAIMIPVTGRKTIIDNIKGIDTYEINIDGISAPGKIFREDRVKLNLPSGVIIPEKDKVKIEVQFVVKEKVQQAMIEKVPINVSFTGNFEVAQNVKYTKVTVEGPMSLVNTLDAKSFNATAASSDKPGSETVEIRVVFSGDVPEDVRQNVKILKWEPVRVDIDLKEKKEKGS